MALQITKPPLVRERWLPMSYEEWLEWVPDGAQSEWVDGKGIIFMPASARHQWAVALLYALIKRFAEFRDLGLVMLAPFEVKLWPGGPAREPDVLFLSHTHRDRFTENRLVGPPDFVGEVMSPSSETRDRVDKLRQYADAAIPEYLFLDPQLDSPSLDLYRLDGRRDYEPTPVDELGRIHSRVLPGLWFHPDWFRGEQFPDADDLLVQIIGDAYLDWWLAKRRAGRAPSGAR
jgi:Uma2 family endonuclease